MKTIQRFQVDYYEFTIPEGHDAELLLSVVRRELAATRPPSAALITHDTIRTLHVATDSTPIVSVPSLVVACLAVRLCLSFWPAVLDRAGSYRYTVIHIGCHYFYMFLLFGEGAGFGMGLVLSFPNALPPFALLSDV